MKKLFTSYFLLLTFLAVAFNSNAQIAAWDFFGQNTGPATVAATTFNANLISTAGANNITRGAGAAGSTANNSFRTTGFQNNGIATTNTDYFQITLTSQPGFNLSLSTINAFMAGTASFSVSPGVTTQFAYSLDGTNFNLIGSPSATIGSPATLATINLSGITALQNIPPGTTATLRFYASGQTTTGGWGFISSAVGVNGLSIGGSITSSISSNADLSDLSLSSGLLTPTFAANTTSYTATVANAVTSITITPTKANANATITVNGVAVVSGNASASILLTVGNNIITTIVTAEDGVTTKTYTITVTRAASGTPIITLTTPLPDFGNVCTNTTAGPNKFIIEGNDLNGSNVDLAALSGFMYSETSGGTFTPTLSFSYTGTGFTGKEIFVQFNPTIVQSYNGNITLSGGGTTSSLITATGAGINTIPSVTTAASSLITATTATAAGTISANGCTSVTAYGIEYSISSGFPNGTGTVVAGANLAAGNFSVNLTGLAPNTRYYYKAFATNNAGTEYGTQQFFTNLPLPVPMAAQSGLSYTETFSDIANWSNFFITGIGANHFSGLSSTIATGIPNGTSLTASTNTFQLGTPGTSGGVQKGTDQAPPIPTTTSIILLSTGATDNTTASAFDFYMDFTGLNAGTLSFDYQSFSNALGTGANDRAGSLKVYTSTDGVTFTELTNVNNFINNTPISGTKTNIPLPASFNNSATARLRFYYHNGTGGTNGSRPKISIDNLNVTAVATTPCATPTAPATALTFGTITDVSIQGSFTAASPTADEYLVVMSVNNSLTANPVNGQIYNIGDNVGEGSVVSRGNTTNFNATGLSPLTIYYFFIFPLNSVCTGGPLYYTASVLNGSASTVAGLPPCIAPNTQPTGLVFGSTGINSIQGSFTATTADEYLVVRSTSATLTNNPIDGQPYTTGDALGNGIVIQKSNATSFTANELSPNTQYYFFVFSLNNQACVNGPKYYISTPLTGTQTTQPLPPCVAPSAQATSLTLTPTNSSIAGTFTGIASADNYLVVRSLLPTISASPTDNTDYNVGDNLGGGIVIANSAATSFVSTGLIQNTQYYFYVFASNKNCSGGTKYAPIVPLTGNIATSNLITNNYYFGNLHAHSDYSDGNTDNPGFTPADDYNYALTAQCMDFLGISEHNHFDAETLLSNYHLGINQATTFNTSNPNFLALYGMEWGTISGGGHVLIYGNGMDDLWGWETGSGNWGSSNNYDTYVPKSVYTSATGLFKTVNDNVAKNTFASLAHPNLSDFNGIANTAPYDAAADDAIAAVAVESGPSTSSNTTYSNPAFSMGYLWYYQTLLSKGYHLGPTIDHDNHRTTFGKTTYSRTAIISPTLSKADITSAIRNMNFYATQDCDTKVDFSINTKIIGSIFTDRFAPNISVTLTDATTLTSSAIIRVMYGQPGSGILPQKIDSIIGSSLSFTDINLSNLATGYYYIDITNGTSRIVTAPIWYTRNDAAVLPITLKSFDVQKLDNRVKIAWATEQEINTSHFTIEKSVDGRSWSNLSTVIAAGNSTSIKNYITYDNTPSKGINYYRLKQIDIDAKYNYSSVKSVSFYAKYLVQVAPNPAIDVIHLYINKAGTQSANVQLINIEGKVVYATKTSESHLQIATSKMGKGLYILKVVDAENVSTIKVQVQ